MAHEFDIHNLFLFFLIWIGIYYATSDIFKIKNKPLAVSIFLSNT